MASVNTHEEQRVVARTDRTIPPEVHGDSFLVLAKRFDQVHDQFYQSPQWESAVRFFETEDRSVLHPDILKRLEQLEKGRALVQEAINHKDSQETLSEIKQKYQKADLNSNGKSPKERAAERLNTFEDFTVITDCDGTITDMQAYRGKSLIDPLLVGSEAVDLLEHEKPEHYLVFTAAIRDYFLKNHPDLYAEGAKMVPLRKDMPKLLKELQESGVRINILSANSRPFVETVAKSCELDITQMGICAVSEHETHGAIAFDKDLVIQLAAIANPNKAIVYFGDGSSDLATIRAKDQIAVYFALEGSSFARDLENESKKDPSIVYFTYKTGEDIRKTLADIKNIQAEGKTLQPLRRGKPLAQAVT